MTSNQPPSSELYREYWFSGSVKVWESNEVPALPNPIPPTPTPVQSKVRVSRLHGLVSVTAPPEVHPIGWLPPFGAAEIDALLSSGQAVLWSDLQTGADSVVNTTDAQGGTFRAYGAGVMNAILQRVPSGKYIIMDPGTYEANEPGWTNGDNAALQVPKTCKGMIGRTPPGTGWADVKPTTARTVIRVKPLTAPAGANTAGAWFKCGYSGSIRSDYANIQWEGTEQGNQIPGGTGGTGPGNDGHSRKNYTNFFSWTQAPGCTMRDCLSTGWFGNNGAPPGETFGFEWYHSTNGVISRAYADGRRANDNVIYGAVGWTFGNSVNCTLSECWFHHGAFAGLVHFQTANCKSYSSVLGHATEHTANHVSVGRTKGDWLNHERTTGNEHYNMVLNCVSVGGANVAQVTHSGDSYVLTEGGQTFSTANGTLKMVNPKWIPNILGGALGIETWNPYGGAPETNQPPNYPVITNTAGNPIPYRWKYDSAGTWTPVN